MNPTAAFPIMMGVVRVPDADRQRAVHPQAEYDLRAALGLTVGGIPGVLIAFYIVKSLPLDAVRWLVVVVVVYTATMLLRASATEPADDKELGRRARLSSFALT